MEIGQIVYSIKGRDAKEYYIITGLKDKYIYLCNGKKRKIENPKKKNITHVEDTNEINFQVKEKLKRNELTNSDIRKILKEFLNKESICDGKEV